MDNTTESGDAGAVNVDPENRKSHIRSSEDDKSDEATPNKQMRLIDEPPANQSTKGVELVTASTNEIAQEADTTAIPANEIDSEVDLGDDDEDFEDQGVEQKETEGEDEDEQLDLEAEYASDQAPGDFDEEFEEEGDIYDEGEEDEMGTTAEETEDNIPEEEADSSTELHDFVQANLAYIEDCQSDIDTLNHKANEEILLVELKYNKLRLPVYKRRNTYIERVPHFWATVFSQHRQLRKVLTKEDVKCLKYVTKLQVEDFEENRSGYSIQFYFSENPWFENSVITKEYHLPWHGSPSCSCTPIQWKKGMNLTMKSSSFFSWFTSQTDASADDIAEIIKDDLWPNPLQCFLLSNKQHEESEEEEEADDSGNLNKDDAVVLLDDSREDEDDIEYISSEDEGWEGEKEQATSAHYLVQGDDAEDEEEDEYDDFDEEELEVTGVDPGGKVQDERSKGEIINIDDDYLGSEDDENDEYFDDTVDLENDERLLQGQLENEDFEEALEEGEAPKISDRLEGTEIQNADSSHDDSHQSNGIVGSSTNEGGDAKTNTETPSVNELENTKSKMQEQSKVVSTSTAGDSDVTAGAT